MQIKMKKITAVTLVELLAVLAIMGTVTALTLPGLKKHSQKTEYAALAQKGYVTLEQALELASDEYGKDIGDEYGGKAGSVLLQTYLIKHMNYVKDCTKSWTNNNACFVGYVPFSGGKKLTPTIRAVILMDGVVIAGRGGGDGQNSFIIDVNGEAPPNREGVDVFLFNYRKYNSNCVEDADNGQWKLCPVEHAKTLMEDGWKINYY